MHAIIPPRASEVHLLSFTEPKLISLAEEKEPNNGRRDENTSSKRNKKKDGVTRANSSNSSTHDQNNSSSNNPSHSSSSSIIDDDDSMNGSDDATVGREGSRGDNNGQETDFSLPPPGRQGGTTSPNSSPVHPTLSIDPKTLLITLEHTVKHAMFHQYTLLIHSMTNDTLSTTLLPYQHTLSTHAINTRAGDTGYIEENDRKLGGSDASGSSSSASTSGSASSSASSSGSATSSSGATVVPSKNDGSKEASSPPGTVVALLPPEATTTTTTTTTTPSTTTTTTPEPSATPSFVPSMNPSVSGTGTGADLSTQLGTVLGIILGTGSEGGGSNSPSPTVTSMPTLSLSGNNNNNVTGEYGLGGTRTNGSATLGTDYPITPTFTPTSIGTELLVNVSVISSTNTTDWFIQNDKEEALSNVTSLISEGNYPSLSLPPPPFPLSSLPLYCSFHRYTLHLFHMYPSIIILYLTHPLPSHPLSPWYT